ncbi:MAG: hypothetical protein ABIO44_10980 [Saprospiraceae bacterium]
MFIKPFSQRISINLGVHKMPYYQALFKKFYEDSHPSLFSALEKILCPMDIQDFISQCC